ncbi:FRG domain-containing protein [Synechococcus sp. CCY 0621]|uniref:FRG domain-containing protein n=1 Tax=Synechococcus sp. CCY 0621 TaxID=2815603 RepID=UPI003369C8E5
MSSHPYPLSKLNHEYGRHVIDAESGLEVFDAPTSHSLIQAAGYLKYNLAKTIGQGVFFRGQCRLYKTLSPSLLRGVNDGPPSVRRRALLDALLSSIEVEASALRAVDLDCREPLLQHYGIRTTWLDVVDNIWIALWFACHTARSVGLPEEYLHFEKRIPNPRVNQEYAYVLLLASAYSTPVHGKPGRFKDDRSETIDLRTAVPSHFVRPHAQHGLLVRRLSNTGQPVSDQLALHVGTIRVRLEAALDWLGDASTLTTHSLFPPAFYDYGYRELLSGVKPAGKVLGSIHRMQA